MTRPHEGDAFIGVHADTTPYEKEADRGIRRASDHLDDTTLKDVGKDFGDTVSKSMGDELEKSGPDLAKRVEKGLVRQKVRTKVKVEFDRDNNVVRRFVETITDDIEGAFDRAGAPGGPFSRIGRGIADAVGAGFNISGKSPLIAFLVPLVGAIIALVVGAIQAVNALIAVLATLPALITAIGLQVGVLFLAFKGLGDAITGAFAAKNAKELNEAIKDLTPSAQKFVRELLPLRDFFKNLAKSAQENFFSKVTGVIPNILKSLGPVLSGGFANLAGALGLLFRDLGNLLASPNFREFVRELFPATIAFLGRFGPAFITFLSGLVDLSRAILPFLSTLGMMLSGTLTQLGEFFTRLSKDPDFPNFLKSMQKTLELVLELVGSVVEFFAVLFSQLDKAGGKDVLQALVDAVGLLAFFLSTDVGKKALEGLIDFSIIAIKVTTGLILAIFLVLAAFEALAEWIKNSAIPSIGEFLNWLGGRAVWLFDVVGGALLWFFDKVGGAIIAGFDAIKKFFTDLWHTVTGRMDDVVAVVKSVPPRIVNALGNIGGLLFEAGRSLIQGLINGIKNMLGPLGSIMSFASQIIRDHWPFSPAKTGPLSGSGDPMIAGQKTIQRLVQGIKMEIPELRSVSNEATSNIVFGRDAIRVSFEGALPTQEQAMQTGSAVGAGISGQLAARNTRLAVRTM